jgi:hypothetical protein
MQTPPATVGELLPFVLLITSLVSVWVPYVVLLPVQEKDPVPNPFIHYTLSSAVSPLSYRHRGHSLGEDHLPDHLE